MAAKTTVTWNGRKIVGMTQKAMAAGMREGGKMARKGIKASLGSKGPSRPGQVPGKVTGDLRKAVGYRTKSRAGKYVAMDVGVIRPNRYDKKFPGEQYAKALRLARGYVGTDRAGRTYSEPGRPFVDPWLKANRDQMVQVIRSTAETWMPKAKKGTR